MSTGGLPPCFLPSSQSAPLWEMQRHTGSSLRGFQDWSAGALVQHHYSPQGAVADSFFIYKLIYFSWRLITLLYCIGFVEVAFMFYQEMMPVMTSWWGGVEDRIRNVNIFLFFGSLWDFIRKRCCIISHGISGGAALCSVAQSCPTLGDPMDCSLLDSSVRGILQAKYWSGLPFSPPGNQGSNLQLLGISSTIK